MTRIYLLTRLLLITVLALWINGCSQKTAKINPIDSIPNAEQSDVETEIDSLSSDDQQDYQQGINALSGRDFSKAKRIFIRFINKHPGLSGAYVNLGLIAFNEGKFVVAEELTNRAININPQKAPAYNLRAQLQLKKGAIKQAQQDYLKAIELYPDYTIAHYNLALLYDIFLQEIALAIEHYSIYLSLLDKEDENTRDWINHLKNTLKNG